MNGKERIIASRAVKPSGTCAGGKTCIFVAVCVCILTVFLASCKTNDISPTDSEGVSMTVTDYVEESRGLTEKSTDDIQMNGTEPSVENNTETDLETDRLESEQDIEILTEPDTEVDTKTEPEPIFPESEPTDLSDFFSMPTDKLHAFDSYMVLGNGRVYGLLDKTEYHTDVRTRSYGNHIFTEIGLLADMLGFDYQTDGTDPGMSNGNLTFTFSSASPFMSYVCKDGEDVTPFPTVIPVKNLSDSQVESRYLVCADMLLDMLGYGTFVNDGILYVSPIGKSVDARLTEEANERLRLYDTVVYNHDNVDYDTKGVGKFTVTEPSERLVGLAYTTWMRQGYPDWGSGTWDLPLLGPYCSDDKDVIYQHGIWLRDAGIDFVFVDWSNNTYYDPETMRQSRHDFRMIEEATDALFEVWSTIPGAPKICIFVGPGHSGIDSVTSGNHQRKVDQVYRDYVEKYPDMYFTFNGKPLLMCYGATPTQYGTNPTWDDERFTVRWVTGYVGQQSSLYQSRTLASKTYWSWEERGTQTFFVSDNAVEAVTVTASSRSQGSEGDNGYIPAIGRNNGETLKRQFARANALGAKLAIVVSFNEWTTGEQISLEISKDLEPSVTYGTFYLDLLREQIKKFKGLAD